MTRRRTAIAVALCAAVGLAGVFVFHAPAGWPMAPPLVAEREGKPFDGRKVVKTDEEWRATLTPEQYRVTRERGTERACSGAFWNTKADGVYHCVCCDQPLFDSGTKFDSGTGWPSFQEAVEADRVTLRAERGMVLRRTEVLCSRCDAHLGHVFPDGPPPTGLRYCINSVALRLAPRLPR